MTEDERREHALRIAQIHLEQSEFCNVYEDEDLEDASREDQLAIHNLIIRAQVVLA